VELIARDFRVQNMVDMLFERYSPQVDFGYQVSTVLALSLLHNFYNLPLTDSQKN